MKIKTKINLCNLNLTKKFFQNVKQMFKAMPLLLGIGDEVLNFFIVTILFAVIYVAWRSTNVREDRFQRTAVLIIENNRRRLIDRVAQHPVTISIRKRFPSECLILF